MTLYDDTNRYIVHTSHTNVNSCCSFKKRNIDLKVNFIQQWKAVSSIKLHRKNTSVKTTSLKLNCLS